MLRLIAGLLFIAGAIGYAPGGAMAQEVGAPPVQPSSDSRDKIIQQLIERVGALERELRALKEAQGGKAPAGAGVQPAPAAAATPAPAAPVSPPAHVAGAPAGPSPTQPSSTPATPSATEPSAPPEEERDVTRVPVAEVSRGGSLLLPGVFQIETNLSYSHNESSQLILSGFSVLPLIILGSLESQRIKSDTITPTLKLRYGILKDLQGEFDLPVAYQTQSRVRLSNVNASLVSEGSDTFGLGDIEAAVTYQPLYERGWIPDVTVSLRGHAPTGRSQFDIYEDLVSKGPFLDVEDFVSRLNAEGLPIGTGFWSVSGSVAASKAFDPVVMFGSLGYTHNFGGDVTVISITGTPSEGGIVLHPQAIKADVKYGDSFNFNLGAAVALTSQVSINFSFGDQISFPSERNGQRLAGSSSNQGLFGAGMTLGLSPTVTLDFGGTIGLTPDASDFTLGLSMIKSFRSIRDMWPF